MVPIHNHRFPRAGIEACRLPVAAEHPGDDQAAEEQHFGRQEQPHAGRSRFPPDGARRRTGNARAERLRSDIE